MELTTEAILERMDNEKFLIGEVADLMYRLQILLVKANIKWESIESEIVNRRK